MRPPGFGFRSGHLIYPLLERGWASAWSESPAGRDTPGGGHHPCPQLQDHLLSDFSLQVRGRSIEGLKREIAPQPAIAVTADTVLVNELLGPFGASTPPAPRQTRRSGVDVEVRKRPQVAVSYSRTTGLPLLRLPR